MSPAWVTQTLLPDGIADRKPEACALGTCSHQLCHGARGGSDHIAGGFLVGGDPDLAAKRLRVPGPIVARTGRLTDHLVDIVGPARGNDPPRYPPFLLPPGPSRTGPARPGRRTNDRVERAPRRERRRSKPPRPALPPGVV
ncbi:MAG: hypothetical protein AVDCRST_MAG19-4974 [uncultured Thermomicrobiales bacterium]|uniref:Uncharacterized protein n=1 Tax=uncultured Thermomicrobiales bacterium TaxID=1645740 RepID=A0A6J4VSJ0_9BACT|nr:MAG: hypothetical protein AVDCRST_MAG19-4974 [uncultured Thermomicrobiales bacterium]